MLAKVSSPTVAALDVAPGQSSSDGKLWFEYVDGEIRLARPAIPAMLATDARAIRADCLCYLIEPLAVPRAENAPHVLI